MWSKLKSFCLSGIIWKFMGPRYTKKVPKKFDGLAIRWSTTTPDTLLPGPDSAMPTSCACYFCWGLELFPKAHQNSAMISFIQNLKGCPMSISPYWQMGTFGHYTNFMSSNSFAVCLIMSFSMQRFARCMFSHAYLRNACLLKNISIVCTFLI